jgi:hypothetical protein
LHADLSVDVADPRSALGPAEDVAPWMGAADAPKRKAGIFEVRGVPEVSYAGRERPRDHDLSGPGDALPVGRPSRGAALRGACPGSPDRDAIVTEANASDTKVRR